MKRLQEEEHATATPNLSGSIAESLRRVRRRVQENAQAVAVCKEMAPCCRASNAQGGKEAQNLWLQILVEELQRTARETRDETLREVFEAAQSERQRAYHEGRRQAYKEMLERRLIAPQGPFFFSMV